MPGTTDTVKAILTPGEFVIRKEAVDMIGAPMLNMINNMPEKGGHSNIDSLIEKATMSNMKGMYGGGMVQAGPKPMGTGGMVDAYAGGGMVMDQYGHGGKVKKNLKPVPQDNPGLGKLPEAVRNKMGYMQEGGEVQESLMGMMYGGMANKKKKGYQEGGMIGPTLPPEMMGQAMNQQLSDSIDMRMANPQMGGSVGVARDQAMALQDSINMNTVDSARKSLQLLRLQSLLNEGGDTLNFEGSMMPPNQEMESTRIRDLLEFLKMQTMQRGMGSVRQGMGDEPMRALR
tara:strand:- start:98 stop:958 length:861 start_codon:yes stop_codon:yes gene_type:complete